MTFRIAAMSGLLVLAVAACGGAATSPPTTAPTTVAPASSVAASATTGAASAPAAVNGIPMTVKDFALEPGDVEGAGSLTLAVTNAGPTVHNVAVRNATGARVATTSDLKPGASEPLALELPAGTYVLYCSLPGHESLGIKGSLTIR
jgi:uncharacterized cupredoxin-like copper-binding protein